MSFVGRARSSVERGDTLRAVLTLVAGLRRTPDRQDALDLLVELVRDDVESGGIEHEIAQVLAPHQRRRDEMLSEMVVGLRAREQDRIADRLVSEAEKRGMRFIPPPEPEPEPDPEPDPAPDPDAQQTPADPESPQTGASDDDEKVVETSQPTEDEAERTRSEERDRRQQEAAEADARLSKRKQEAIAQRQADLAAKRRRRTIQIIVFALLVGVGFVGVYVFGAASRSSDLTAVDGAIHTFDRFDQSALQTVTESVASREEPEFSERLAFARAVSGEPTDVRLDGWSTQWGLAAAALSALAAGDVESALALVTKLERSEPGGLAADFARARLEEHRGNSDEARAAASRVIDRYPEFAPAHEIVLRTAARQFDFEAKKAAADQLARVAPNHPYAVMAPLPHPRDVLLGSGPKVEAPQVADDADPFIRAAAAYRSAVAAVADSDLASTIDSCREALEADARFLPARLLLATALTWSGDLEGAVAQFDRSAEQTRSTFARLLMQAVAPFALTGAGRPDLAAKFTTPFPKLRAEGVNDQFDEQLADTRPATLRKSALTDAAVVPWAAEALFARAMVLADRGDIAAAAATYRALQQRNIAPGRAATRLAVLRARSLQQDGAADESVAEVSALTTMVHDFAAGRFRAASAAPLPDLAEWARPLATRLRVRALLALGRYHAAERMLRDAELGLAHQPRVDGVRLVTAAHRGLENAEFVRLRDQIALNKPASSTSLLDLAEAMFWQRQFSQAEELIALAEKKFQGRRAAFLCGLVNTGRGRGEDAAACFARTGLQFDVVPGLLVAVGFAQLEMKRPQKSRELFAAALESEPSHPDAARGLGEALVDTEGRRAKGAIEAAIGTASGAEAKAELERWLAVARGVRRGEEEALPALQRAAETLGERADLLAERARYHAAREEWEVAEQLYESALRRDDALARVHVAVARLKLRREDGESARRHLERYLELEPKGASADWARRQLE